MNSPESTNTPKDIIAAVQSLTNIWRSVRHPNAKKRERLPRFSIVFRNTAPALSLIFFHRKAGAENFDIVADYENEAEAIRDIVSRTNGIASLVY